MRLNEVFSPLLEEKALEPYEEQIKAYFKRDVRIYRGIKSDADYIIADGRNVNRTSSETYNFVNLLVSGVLPEWRKYPPRNKSFICTLARHQAEQYGDIYYVIPLEHQYIGVCPKRDFWGAFSKIRLVDPFNDALFRLAGSPKDIDPDKADVTDLKAVLEKADKNLGEIDYFINTSKYEVLTHIFTEIKNFNGSMYDFCKYAFDPASNGFKLSELATLGGEKRNEVWMTGKVIMLREEFVDFMGWVQNET